MAERKVKMTIPGLGAVEGTEVGMIESVERWTELRLDDGSVLRVKPVVMSVARVDGRYDPQGNPMYLLQATQTMVVASAPDHLRQQGPEPQKVH